MSRNTIIAINLFFVVFNIVAFLYNNKKGRICFSITHAAFFFVHLFFMSWYILDLFRYEME